MTKKIFIADSGISAQYFTETMRDILKLHLSKEGLGENYEIVPHSIDSAIESLSARTEDIALVIADPGNPENTAHTFFRNLTTPFIGITGYSNQIPCYGEKYPDSKYCEKPVKVSELLNMVNRKLGIAA